MLNHLQQTQLHGPEDRAHPSIHRKNSFRYNHVWLERTTSIIILSFLWTNNFNVYAYCLWWKCHTYV